MGVEVIGFRVQVLGMMKRLFVLLAVKFVTGWVKGFRVLCLWFRVRVSAF